MTSRPDPVGILGHVRDYEPRTSGYDFSVFGYFRCRQPIRVVEVQKLPAICRRSRTFPVTVREDWVVVVKRSDHDAGAASEHIVSPDSDKSGGRIQRYFIDGHPVAAVRQRSYLLTVDVEKVE